MEVLIKVEVADTTISRMRQEAAESRLVSAIRERLMIDPLAMLGSEYQVGEVTQVVDSALADDHPAQIVVVFDKTGDSSGSGAQRFRERNEELPAIAGPIWLTKEQYERLGEPDMVSAAIMRVL